MSYHDMKKKAMPAGRQGFSLIELIVVIAITGVLLAVALPNLLSARERARDSKRKDEMQQLKNALRMYYTDFQRYPAAANCGTGKFNYISGCGATQTACCPCDTTGDFAVGVSCATLYMKKFPAELGSRMFYYQAASTDDFCLKVALENAADSDIATSKSRCSTSCGTNCNGTSDFCVCAD